MHIEKFFPTLIGLTDYEHHNLIEEKLSNKCLSLKEKIKKGGENWVSNKTYNTISTYDLNSFFLVLLSTISKKLFPFNLCTI